MFPGSSIQNLHIEGGKNAIKVEGGHPLFLNNVSVSGYEDTGLHARDTQITAKDVHFQAKDARLGWDFERDVQANLYDSVVKDHREADIRYGPDVVADIAGVEAREVYDKARRENPLLPSTGLQEIDMAVNTSEKKLRQQRNRSRVKWLMSRLARQL